MSGKERMVPLHRPWIGGRSHDGAGLAVEVLASPWDGAEVARVAMADRAAADAAVACAGAAFRAGRGRPAAMRAEWLRAAAAEAERAAEAIAAITVRALGKPLRAARLEVSRTVELMRLCADEIAHVEGEVLPLDALPAGKGRFGFTRRFPHGVVAAFTPFNAPSYLLMQKVSPALAMGNAVIVKPAVEGMGEALTFAECFKRVGVPDGLVNVVPCRRDVAAYLAGHEGVDMVTLTGGAVAGHALARAAGAKPFVGEFGGNAANIVCADADLRDAAQRIACAAFEASGQQCVSAQRVIVDQEVLEEFLGYFVAAAKALKVGDPSLPDTDVGPMVNAAAADRVEAMVAEAVARGAKAVLPLRRYGAAIHPTILVAPPPDARVVREEVFGPVAAVLPARDLNDAIRIANDSAFGLQSACFTESLDTAFRMSEELHVGSLWINDASRFRLNTVPFGGVGASGVGREGVKYAMRELSYLKFTGIRFPGRETR